jgi:hypothetical protein
MKKLDRESTGNGKSNGNGNFIDPIVDRLDLHVTKKEKEKKETEKLKRESTGNGNSNENGTFIDPIVSPFDRHLTKEEKMKREKKKEIYRNLTGNRLTRGIRVGTGVLSIQRLIGLTGI